MAKDLTLEVLKQIRDEVKSTRDGVDGLKAELQATRTELSSRIDQTNERLEGLERRQVETELRLSTEIVAVAGAIHGLKDVLLDDRKLRHTVANHEERISALERAR